MNRVLIEATPCGGYTSLDPISGARWHETTCSCHGTGYLIPSEVSSPVRYEPGTQIAFVRACPECGRDCVPDAPSGCEGGRVLAVATVDACYEVRAASNPPDDWRGDEEDPEPPGGYTPYIGVRDPTTGQAFLYLRPLVYGSKGHHLGGSYEIGTFVLSVSAVRPPTPEETT